MEDGSISIWAPGRNMRPFLLFDGHTEQLHQISFSPNGRYLASTDYDRKLIIWSTKVKSFRMFLSDQIKFFYISHLDMEHYLHPPTIRMSISLHHFMGRDQFKAMHYRKNWSETGKENNNNQNKCYRINHTCFMQHLCHQQFLTIEYVAAENQCVKCKKTSHNMKRCSRCRSVFYCNAECQFSHWSNHKTVCQKK